MTKVIPDSTPNRISYSHTHHKNMSVPRTNPSRPLPTCPNPAIHGQKTSLGTFPIGKLRSGPHAKHACRPITAPPLPLSAWVSFPRFRGPPTHVKGRGNLWLTHDADVSCHMPSSPCTTRTCAALAQASIGTHTARTGKLSRRGERDTKISRTDL